MQASSLPQTINQYPEVYRAGWDTASAAKKPRNPLPWILALVGVGVAIGISIIVVSGMRTNAMRTPTTIAADGSTLNAVQVDVGMCLESVPATDTAVKTVTVVPCDIPHRAEVVVKYSYSPGLWPGAEEAREEILTYCADRVRPTAGSSMFQVSDWDAGVRWLAWAPTKEGWDAGDTTGLCLVYRDDDMLGSFVGGTIELSEEPAS